MQQPLFAEQADVEVDAIESPQRPHRVGAVLEHVGRPHRVGPLEELRERPLLHVVVELGVVETAPGQSLLAPALGDAQARAQVVDGVHAAGVVDVVRGDERGVERARARGVEELEHVVGRVVLPGEDAVDPEVLRTHVRAQVLPFRILWIGGRLDGVRPHVTEGAGHAHPIGADEVLGQVVLLVFVVLLRVPPLGRRLVEGGVGKQAQADDPRRIAVERSQGKVLAPGAEGHPGILLVVFEWIGRAAGGALVEPQVVALGVRAGRLFEAGLVGQSEVVPAIVPAELEGGVGGHDLEEIEIPEAVDGNRVPEAIVAACPHHPGVAPLDLLARQGLATVHVVEVVFVRRGKTVGFAACCHRFIQDCSGRRRLFAASTKD